MAITLPPSESMNKKIAEQLVAFYRILLEVIRSEKFDKTVAQSLAATYEEHKKFLTTPEATIAAIRQWRREYQDPGGDMETITTLSECAFTDLAFQLRNPEVQTVIEGYLNSAGTFTVNDIYAQIRNVRLLGKDENGPAVVTIAVSSLSTFADLMKDVDGTDVEYSHCSIASKAVKAIGGNLGIEETGEESEQDTE
jgi:hypothetical protein